MEFIQKCLQVTPENRPSIQELLKDDRFLKAGKRNQHGLSEVATKAIDAIEKYRNNISEDEQESNIDQLSQVAVGLNYEA